MADKPIALSRACIKLLSATEADPKTSNQHEFNGVVQLQQIFGVEGFEREAIFSLRGESVSDTAKVTWYDARRNHPTRSEHRLYFRSNKVMERAHEGDNILIGFDNADRLHCVLIPSGANGYQKNAVTWQVAEDAST
jgi:hypothetical protein